MPKKILEDIKPLTRTRRNTTPVRKTKASDKEEKISDEPEMDLKINTYDSNISFDDGSAVGGKRLSLTLWIITLAALAFLFIVLSSVFAKATVEIKPKSVTGSLDTTFVAKKDTTDELGFQIMSISDEVNQKVTSAKKETVENSAKGTVILYNEFSANKQSLLIDTRLLATDGKIFKTEKAVIIPGYTKKGSEITPGSVEVNIYADVAGIEYNKDTADFKIFGFKGSSKYDKFYARSKGAITGGFKGERYVVDQEKAEEVANTLEDSLTEKLNSAVMAQIPNGYLVFDDSFNYNLGTFDSSSVYGTTEEFDVTLKGSVVAYIFEESQLASEIAKILSSQYDGSSVKISDLGGTQMEIDEGTVSDSKSIRFKLTGEPTITWSIDQEAIKNSLIGSTRKQFETILTDFTGVDSGKASIRPFWKKTFPKSSNKIEIIVTGENE